MHALRNNISQVVDPDVNMLINLLHKMVGTVLSCGFKYVCGFLLSYRKS